MAIILTFRNSSILPYKGTLFMGRGVKQLRPKHTETRTQYAISDILCWDYKPPVAADIYLIGEIGFKMEEFKWPYVC